METHVTILRNNACTLYATIYSNNMSQQEPITIKYSDYSQVATCNNEDKIENESKKALAISIIIIIHARCGY